MNDFIFDKERFKEITKKTNKKFYEWVTNINEFDYSSFDLEWLSMCSEPLCKKIAEDSFAREKIIQIYKEKYLAHNITSRTTDFFVKYFI